MVGGVRVAQRNVQGYGYYHAEGAGAPCRFGLPPFVVWIRGARQAGTSLGQPHRSKPCLTSMVS